MGLEGYRTPHFNLMGSSLHVVESKIEAFSFNITIFKYTYKQYKRDSETENILFLSYSESEPLRSVQC